MAELSERAKGLVNRTVIEPQLILEVEGLPLFSVRQVYRIPRFDDPDLYFDMPDLRFDDVVPEKSAHSLIDLSRSTQVITQQLFQDKGIASSVSSLTVSLVDKNELLTQILSPGVVIEDLLSRKANLYLNFDRGAHPEDSVLLLSGVVDIIDAGAGEVKLRVSHPDGLKRQDVFTKIQAKLTSRLRYRSKQINGVDYQTQDAVVGSVTVAITSGGTKGSEVVTVVGNAITIQANTQATNPADRSTASNIVSAIKKVQAAVNLVEVSTVDDMDGTPQSVFSATVLDSSTTVDLDTTGGMFTPSADGTFKTYVRIGDEIIQYTGITGNSLTGLTRGEFGSVPRTYDIDEDVETRYRLMGTMKDIALKLMLSRGRPLENIEVYSFVELDAVTQIPNAIIFSNVDVKKRHGVTVGDFVSCAEATNTENNFLVRRIVSVVTNDLGSYVVVDGAPLVVEPTTVAKVSFASKYDVWPDGLGMQIDQVDVKRHEELVEFFPSGFFDYDYLLTDTIRGDDFLEKKIYHPSACFGIPRGGRSSLGLTMPPLAQEETKVLDENNIVNPSNIRIVRTFTEDFYNSVIWKFDMDAVDEEMKRGVVKISQVSLDRVPNVKNIPYRIEAEGIRDTVATRSNIETQSKRILDRYQYGAEKIPDVEVLFKDGIDIEVGSTVVFGSEKLMVSDSTIGSRKFRPRVMEVKNIKKDIAKGRVTLSLLNTNYSVDSKYGVIGPSSIIGPGATSTRLPLLRSFGTTSLQLENYKWKVYVGQNILIRKEDWSEAYTAVFRGFEEANPDTMILNPALPIIPQEGWIVEIPPYPDTNNPNDNALWKGMHIFFDPQVVVVSAPALNQIEVPPADIEKFYIGSPVEIHNEDYTRWTGELSITVKEIAGNILTLNRSVDFTVEAGDVIELIGFKDGGAPYRLL